MWWSSFPVFLQFHTESQIIVRKVAYTVYTESESEEDGWFQNKVAVTVSLISTPLGRGVFSPQVLLDEQC